MHRRIGNEKTGEETSRKQRRTKAERVRDIETETGTGMEELRG